MLLTTVFPDTVGLNFGQFVKMLFVVHRLLLMFFSLGVQFAWIAVSLVTIPLLQWYSRRREKRVWKIQRQAEK